MWLACVAANAEPQLPASPLPPPIQGAPTLSLDDCVRVALRDSAQIQEAEALVSQYQARLAEVESVYYPKLMGMGFVAPMYTVEGDILGVKRKYKFPQDWGPYARLQATLAQPLYTFGRQEAGENAAKKRVEMEKARVREVENTVVLELRKLYYMRMYALSIMPALNSARRQAIIALEKGEELYERGTGEVTQTDLNKLRYAEAEIDRFILLAKYGADLALAAMKHTMGLPDNVQIAVAGEALEEPSEEPEPELSAMLKKAADTRPEWDQLRSGKAAAISLAQAEQLANAPVVFLGGVLNANWAPTRDNATNPYWFDQYNGVDGGVALGLLFNLDPWLAAAKADGARGLEKQADALTRFAGSGIPLQVRKAHAEVLMNRDLVQITDRGVSATRKWMTFAAAAYGTGTGEAKDLLEGLVFYLQARRAYFESLQNYHIARAELMYATGQR